MANNTLSVNITANTSEAQGEVDKLQAKIENISAASLKKELKSIKELMKEALKSGDSDAFSNLSKQAQAVEKQLNTLPKPMKSLKQAAREAKNEVQKLAMAGLKSGDKMFDEAVKKAGLLEQKMKTTTATIEKSADAASSIHGLEEAFGAVGVVTTQASSAIKGLTGAEVDLSGASEQLGVVTGALNGALALKTALGAKSYFQTQILSKITETYNTILTAQNIQESTSGIVKAGLTAKTVVLTAAQTAYNVVLSITKFLTGDVVGITMMLGAAVVGTVAYFASAESEQKKYNDTIQNTIDTQKEFIETLKDLLPMYSTKEAADFYNSMTSYLKQFKDAQNDKDESSKREKTKEILDEIAEKEHLILTTSDLVKLSAMEQTESLKLLAIQKNVVLNKSKETLYVERMNKRLTKEQISHLRNIVDFYNELKQKGKSCAAAVDLWKKFFSDLIQEGYKFEDVVKNINATTSQTTHQFSLLAAEFQNNLNAINESSVKLGAQFKTMVAVWNQLDNATKIKQFETMQSQLRNMGIYVQNIADAESVLRHNAAAVYDILVKQAKVQGTAEVVGKMQAEHDILVAKKNKTPDEIARASELSGQIQILERSIANSITQTTAAKSKLTFFNPPKTNNSGGSSHLSSSSSPSSSSRSSRSSRSSSSSRSSQADWIQNATLSDLNKKYLNTWDKLDTSELRQIHERLHQLKKTIKKEDRTGLLSSDLMRNIGYKLLYNENSAINDKNIDEFIRKYERSHNGIDSIADRIGIHFYKEDYETGDTTEVSKDEYQKNVNASTQFRYISSAPKLSIRDAERYNGAIDDYNETEKNLYDEALNIFELALRSGPRFEKVYKKELDKLNQLDLPDDAAASIADYFAKIMGERLITLSAKDGSTTFSNQKDARSAAENYIKEKNIQNSEPFVYLSEDGSWNATYVNPNQYIKTAPKSIDNIETDQEKNPYANFQAQVNDFVDSYEKTTKNVLKIGTDIGNPRHEMSEFYQKLENIYQTDFAELPSNTQRESLNEMYRLGGSRIPDFVFDPKSLNNISEDTKRTLISLLVTNYLNQKTQTPSALPQDVSDDLNTYLTQNEDLSPYVNDKNEIDYKGLAKKFTTEPQTISDPATKYLLTLYSEQKKQNGVEGNYMNTWKESGFYGQRVQPGNESDTDFQNKLKNKQDQVDKFKENLNEMQQVTSTVTNSISSIFGSLANDSSKQWAKMASEIAKFAGSIVTSALSVVSAYLTMSAAKAVGNSSKDIISFAIAVAAAATTLTVGIISLTQNLKKHAQGGILGKFTQGANSISGVFSGNSVGDMNLARVNGGEMIINKNQQTRLFNQLNQPINNQPTSNQKVQFVIRGKDLYGTLQNHINISQKL